MGNVEHDRQRGHTIAGAVAPAGAPVVAAAVPVQERQSVEELRAARLRSIMQHREQQAAGSALSLRATAAAAAAAANEKGQGKDGEEDEDEDEDHEGLEGEVV